MNLARDKPDLVEDLVDELIENLNDGSESTIDRYQRKKQTN